MDLLTNGSDITTAAAQTSTAFVTTTQVSGITVTSFSTITETESCDTSDTTDDELPPAYTEPVTTTTSSISACATPSGQFVIQLDNTNLYLTGRDTDSTGPSPGSNTDVTAVTTSDYADAISFSAALDGNGQVTLVSSDGTTLFSDQDAITGSGDGPIYWDSFDIFSNGDYFPVQFCLQPDDSFVVQNRLGTDDTSDDANVVQICPDSLLYLYKPSIAAGSGCNTVRLRLAQVPPGYSIPTTTTATSSATPTPTPSPSVCVPVPDGQEFHVSLVGESAYLTGAAGDGGAAPVEQTLITTTNYSQAIPFQASPGRDGQITFINADGTTLYSDQDLGGNGDGPVYFDDLDTISNSNMFPVQFCLQPDNTFVVQNLGNDKTDPADDANVVQICPADGAVYLYTADRALASGWRTVRLQIAPEQTAQSNKFRIRLSSTSEYLTTNPPAAVPPGTEIMMYMTPDPSLAYVFEKIPGQDGRTLIYNTAGVPLYPNQSPPSASGPVYANRQAEVDFFQHNLVLFFVQLDGTIAVSNLGDDQADPADDANEVLVCPDIVYLLMYAASSSEGRPADCVVQTLVAEFV